jgi:hypothetical protein
MTADERRQRKNERARSPEYREKARAAERARLARDPEALAKKRARTAEWHRRKRRSGDADYELKQRLAAQGRYMRQRDEPAYRKRKADAMRRYRSDPANRIKAAARAALLAAIDGGRVVPGACEVCGTRERVHGHHDDYARPLEVRWLCRVHHDAVHQRAVLLAPIAPPIEVRPRRQRSSDGLCFRCKVRVRVRTYCEPCALAYAKAWREKRRAE